MAKHRTCNTVRLFHLQAKLPMKKEISSLTDVSPVIACTGTLEYHVAIKDLVSCLNANVSA